MSIQDINLILIGLYALAAVAYIYSFIAQNVRSKRISSLILAMGIVVHLALLFMLSKALGRLPLGNVFEVLSGATFLFALFYIILEFYVRDKSLGVVIAPIILIFQVIGFSGIDTSKALSPQLQGMSFQIHVAFMLLAYSGFTLAFIASVMHLLLAKEIHEKKLGFFFSRIPSLELLDRLNSASATLGFGFATIGMFWGFFMAVQLWGNPMPLDAKFISFLLTWAIYGYHLYARLRLGWQGERSAWLSIVGFLFVLLTFLIVSLFFTQMHLYR